jgi:hypothetical protein
MHLKKSLWMGPGALVTAALCAACGGSVVASEVGGTTGAGAGASTASTAGDGGSAGTGQGPGSGGAGGSTGTGMGGSSVCGGLAGIACPPEDYCQFVNQNCGGDDDEGTCVPRPVGCPEIYNPQCGCDDKVYDNACEANAAGVDVNAGGGCTPPSGQFDCGPGFCTIGAAYCQVDTSDVGNEPTTYGCQPLPASCGDTPSCACLAEVTCGSQCMGTNDGGGFEVFCPGG